MKSWSTPEAFTALVCLRTQPQPKLPGSTHQIFKNSLMHVLCDCENILEVHLGFRRLNRPRTFAPRKSPRSTPGLFRAHTQAPNILKVAGKELDNHVLIGVTFFRE